MQLIVVYALCGQYMFSYTFVLCVYMPAWERSGSVVDCLTQDQGAAGLSLTGVTALCS